MLKKCFIITEFGNPFDWTQEYIDNVQHLEKYGWYWKIFTPNEHKSKGNVEVIKMDTSQFNDLVEEKLQLRPNFRVSALGRPTVHITDYYVFSGVIFADYLKDVDFWGITNMDVVYGRLDHFVPDSLLTECELFTDDVNAINGVFSLWKNTDKVNHLFERIPNWQKVITQLECPECLNGSGGHRIFGSDEVQMTEVMKSSPDVIYKYPPYYPMHGYDRLEQHQPTAKIEIREDGALCELFKDIKKPDFKYGREIPYYHFSHTKKWPL